MPVVELEVAESSVDLLREFERTGRPEPFEAFMRRHASMVYATCLKVTRDPHDAEDATQATFLTLASKSRLNGEIRQPEAWLRKVAHRLALDLIRSKKRRVNRENLRSEMTGEAAPLDSHDHADKGEIKGILNEELAKLPASYRMPLILHYFGGLSRDEMAAQLKLKPSTLGVRLHRAREQLRRKLAGRGILLPAIALTALLTEVVRGSVCGHLMSHTARQASAIALGTAAAPTMFSASAAGTGVDSLGALLGMLAHGKLKIVLTAAIVMTSAISFTSGRVQQFLPAALRDLLPTFGLPTIPKLEFRSPVPTLFSQNIKTSDIDTSGLASPIDPMAQYAAINSVLALSATDNLTPALTTVQPTLTVITAAPVIVLGPAAAPVATTTTPQLTDPFTPTTPTVTPVVTRPHPSLTPVAVVPTRPTTPVAPSELPVAFQSTAPGSDPWNSVFPMRDPATDSPGPAVPEAIASAATTAADQAAPEHVLAPVTGAVPTLSSGGAAGGGGGGGSSATNVLPQSSTGLVASRTTVFAGTSANYGGYADADWKPTQLTDLSSSLGNAAADAGYSFSDGPGIPGESLSINGARVTLHNTSGTGDLSVTFVDTTSTAIPTLPTGHHFIGVWELDCHQPFESADLLVRYDDLRAARLNLNEQILKLWVSDGKTWTLMWLDPTFGRDVNQNLLWVTAPGDFKFFAVSAPEPTTGAAALGVASVLLRRRRRL